MDRARAGALLDAMRAGGAPPAPLSGQAFQRLVFWAMVERVLPDLAEGSSIEEHPQGVIDIVVTERPSSKAVLFSEPHLHYFECKHHARPLELDTIAKTLVVGVRDQPLSLSIVSASRLLPQALDYAYALFAGGDPTRPPMFRHPVFRHFTVAELLAPTWRHSADTARRAQPDKLNPEVSWSFSECLPFLERVLASSDTDRGSAPIRITIGSTYRLSLWAPPLKEEQDLSFASSIVGCQLVSSHTERTPAGVRFDAFLSCTTPARAPTLGVVVVATDDRGGTAITPALPVVIEAASSFARADVRSPHTLRLASRLAHNAGPRLLFVEGPAGVGKTFFCEALATRLRAEHGFDADRFTLDASTDASFLQRMLIGLFTPASARADGRTEIGAELADALLRQAAGWDSPPRPIGPELIIPTVVRGLACLGDRLLILRDCHLVSEASAAWIWLLASGLDDIGWGGVKLVLESRSPDDERNPYWVSLRQRLKAHIKGSAVENLVPLKRTELTTTLRGWFAHIDIEAVDAIVRRTGGLPLLVVCHLNALIAEGIIEIEADDRFRIISPSAFAQSSALEVAGEAILRQTIGQIDWRAAGAGLPKGVTATALLGLIAALGEQAIALTSPLLGIDDGAWRTAMDTFSTARVGRFDEAGQWWFSHELMRAMALTVAAESDDLDAIVDRLEALAPANLGVCEPLADVAGAAGRANSARRLYNAAYEQAVRAEDFTARLRIVRKLVHYSAADKDDEGSDRRLSMLNELGWAEWTAGSLLEARKAYDTLAVEALESTRRGAPMREAAHRAADGRRRALGVSLELGDWCRVVEDTKSVFELGPSKGSFASTLNRLVQASARMDLPGLGICFAALGMPHLGDDAGENAAAVLATDLSHLYLAAEPALAIALIERAVVLSETPRQRAYGRLNLLTAQFVSTGRIEEAEAEDLGAEIHRSGYVTMRGRLDLLRACNALQTGELAIARILLDQAGMTSALYAQHYLDPALQNAELIWSILKQDLPRVAHNLTAAKAVYAQWASDRGRIQAGFERLVEPATQLGARFNADLNQPFELPAVIPAFSGAGYQLGDNLAKLGSLPRGAERPKQPSTADRSGPSAYVPHGPVRLGLAPH